MEMEIGKLTATLREKQGKGHNRKLRTTGIIPAVLYGNKGESEMLSLDPSMLQKSLDPVKKSNTLITLTVEGPAGTKQETVMLKDYQRDALSQELIHVDLVRVDPNKKLSFNIHLRLTGRSIGVQLGGRLNQVFRTLPIECVPGEIPAEILADVTHLETGMALSVSELKLPEGLEVNLPDSQTIAVVVQPKGIADDEVTDEEGEGEGEGEEGEGDDKGDDKAKGDKAKGDKAKSDGKPAK
ncbi:MAG: 50S ribosomal protein L25 [Deltaproteobacteria bacterium]|nr:50S ribosomal protein L25 [Deltaproteobacteria bacterium]